MRPLAIHQHKIEKFYSSKLILKAPTWRQPALDLAHLYRAFVNYELSLLQAELLNELLDAANKEFNIKYLLLSSATCYRVTPCELCTENVKYEGWPAVWALASKYPGRSCGNSQQAQIGYDVNARKYQDSIMRNGCTSLYGTNATGRLYNTIDKTWTADVEEIQSLLGIPLRVFE